MGESFQDYSWIQDSKCWIRQIKIASLVYFEFILGQLTILLEIINDL